MLKSYCKGTYHARWGARESLPQHGGEGVHRRQQRGGAYLSKDFRQARRRQHASVRVQVVNPHFRMYLFQISVFTARDDEVYCVSLRGIVAG